MVDIPSTRRLVASLTDAVSTIGGYDVAADMMGVKYNYFYNRLTDHHKSPTLRDMYGIIALSGDQTTIETICHDFGQSMTTKTQRSAETIVLALIHSINENSDVAQAYEDELAKGKGHLSLNGQRRILREISEAIDSLSMLRNTVLQAPTED